MMKINIFFQDITRYASAKAFFSTFLNIFSLFFCFIFQYTDSSILIKLINFFLSISYY